MATQVQNRRGTTAEHSTFTGAVGEVTIDTDKDTAVVHDGSTAGGRPLLREDLSNLPAGAIDNADINASAAIAGTKISPNFGSQNVTTTGTSTAASFIPTSSTVPTNGVYLPAANSVALSTNGTGRLFVDASGNLLVGTFSSGSQSGTFGQSIRGSNPGLTFIGTEASGAIRTIYESAGNLIFFNGTGGTEIARFNSSGQLGIGTSSPSYTLDVTGTHRNSGIYFNQNDTPQGTAGTITSHSVVGLTTRGITGSVFDWSVYSADGTALITNGTGTNNVAFPGGNVAFTGGSVGIGTTSPSAPLAFAGSTGRKVGFYQGTEGYSIGVESSEFRFVTDAGAAFTFRNGSTYSSSTEYARIDSSGRLGIGTSAPSQRLSIGGSGGTLSGTAAVSFFDSNSASSRRWSISNGAGGNTTDLIGKLVISYGGTSTADPMTGTAAAVFDSSGRLGIGTTSPGTTLEVNGGCQITGSASGFSGGEVRLGAATADLQHGISTQSTGNPILFFDHRGTGNTGIFAWRVGTNGASERMRIDSSGRLGIGTTSPSETLHVVGNGRIGNNTTNPDFTVVSSNTGNPGADTRVGTLKFAANANNVSDITAERNCGITATTGSDERFTNLDFYTSTVGGGAARVRIDSSGRVGIGTTSPGQPLEVNGVIRGGSYQFSTSSTTTAEYLGFSNSNGPTLEFWGSASANAGSFLIKTAGSERARIDSSGRLGIGTSTPQGLCDVAGSNGRLVLANGNTSGGMKITAANSAYNANGYLAFEGYSSEYGRFDSSGRLLVGASSSIGYGGLLQVVGGDTARPQIHRNVNDEYPAVLYISKARGTGVQSVLSGDEIGNISFIGYDGTQQLNAASITCFVDGTPGTNDMPGRIVLATTADGASSPTERMRIGSGGHLYATCSDTALASLTLKKGAAGADGIDYLQCRDSSNTAQLVIASNGNVTNTNNSYGALSDIKLKENIVDANSQWDDLKALQVRNYNLKEGQTHTQIGLIAQEVELVSPGLVSESPDRDAEGNDLGTVTKSVNYSVLYMKAVKALQEAMERIETLEAKVAALESA